MQASHAVVGGEVRLEEGDVDDGRDDVVDGVQEFMPGFFARRVVVQREVVFACAGEGDCGGAADALGDVC